MGRRYRRQASGKFVASAAAAGLGLAVLSGHHGHLPAIPGAAVNASEHGMLGCAGLEALWESAGGSRSAAFTAAEIAMAESGGRQYATLVNADGTTDRGYWQINSVHGALSTYHAAGNARAAVAISANGASWSPWVTYQTGAYASKC